MARAAGILGLVLLGLFAVLLLFSPFKRHQGEEMSAVNCTIEIDAPVDSVYVYLGNSANASDWSVFVDHITPLNPKQVPDGSPGSLRRCFQQADEQGIRWDEEILIAEQGRRRRLSIFNLIDFPMEASGLGTEQRYQTLPGNRTRLTFTVFYLRQPSNWDYFKTLLGAWRIRDVFEKNLHNIKKEIEP